MSVKIKLKHSSTAGKVPTAGDLDAGEVALNTSDVKAYIKNAGGAVVQLAGSGADATKVDKAGDTMTGALVLPAAAPTADAEAANKKYVDDQDALAVAKTGDTMTGDLNLPNLVATGFASVLGGSYSRTGDTDGYLFIGQRTDFTKVFTVSNDGDAVAAGDVQMASLNGGPLAGLRNQIINGDFRIWQRGTSFANPGGNMYTVDRWKEAGSAVGATTSRSTSAPAGFAYSTELDSNCGSFQHGIELDTAGTNSQFPVGSQWTLSVWSNKSLVGTTVSICRFRELVGRTSGQVDAGVFSDWAPTGETSNGFTRFSSAVTITGNASTNAGIVCLNISLPTGVELGGVSYAGVQLEPGTVATPFEHRPIGLELSLCQRYFVNAGRIFAYVYKDPSTERMLSREINMRGKPSSSITGESGGPFSVGGSASSTFWYATTSTASAGGGAYATVTLDAEL